MVSENKTTITGFFFFYQIDDRAVTLIALQALHLLKRQTAKSISPLGITKLKFKSD